MKKLLSIILSLALLIGTVSVITLIPAVAETTDTNTTPVNLIVNGDGSGIDTDGDGVKDKWHYTQEDEDASTYAGEFKKDRTVGWRVLTASYANSKIYYPHTFDHVPSGYYSNYSKTEAIGLNQGQTLVQDVTLEAGKSYVISAKIASNVITVGTQTGRTVSMFLDAKSGLEAATAPTGVDWVTTKTFNYEVTDTVYEDDGTTVKTTYYSAGDFTDHQITVNADEFAAANDLEAVDGKYSARLVFLSGVYGNVWTLFDDITMYETLSVTAGKGGYVDTDTNTVLPGETVTATSVPYYGNTFLGWFDAQGNLVSSLPTYNGTITSSITAKFNVYNQIVDGSFETETGKGADYFNSLPLQTSSGKATIAAVPTGSSAIHGNYALKQTNTTTANTNCYVLNIPVTLKKNTEYAFHISYYTPVAYQSYLTVHADNGNYTNIYTASAKLGAYSWHWEKEGTTNYAAWTGVGTQTAGTSIRAVESHTSVNAAANTWIDQWLVFNSGSDGSIFDANSDTAEAWISFGVGNSATNTFYIDNVSFCEAADAQYSALSVDGSKGGTVTYNETDVYTPEKVYYFETGGTKNGTSIANQLVENGTRYAQLVTNTGSYTAAAYDGYTFAGWYDEDGNLYSKNATQDFYVEGKYTAKFVYETKALDGGYVVGNEDGSVTAKPYYGNGFLGWYNGDTLSSSDPTIDNAGGLTPRFDIKNLISGGDMEIENSHEGILDFYNNAEKKYGSYPGTAEIVSSDGIENTDATYGDYVLKVTPNSKTAASKRKGLLNIPVTIEKNTDYIWRFSYKYEDELSVNFNSSSIHYLYYAVDSLVNGSIPWGNAASTIKWSYHSQPSGTKEGSSSFVNEWSWGGGNAMTSYTSDNGTQRQGVWQDVYILFNAGEDSTVFGENNTATLYLTIGTPDSTADSIYFDNISVTKAIGNANASSITSGNNGNIVGYRLGDNYYTYTNHSRGSSTAEDGSTISSYTERDLSTVYTPDMYVPATAVPNDGYVVLGWYDGNNNILSESNTYPVNLIGGTYNALFGIDTSISTITAAVKPQNGIYGGYIVGDKTLSGKQGTTATVTASTYIGNTFDGWYIGDTKVSSDAQYTFVITENADLVARFNIGNLWPDAGFENTARDVSLLYNKATQQDENAYFEWDSTALSKWWDAKVLTKMPLSGEASLELTHRNNEVVRKVSGLTENTDYEFSFNWYIRNTHSSATAASYLNSINIYDEEGILISRATPGTEYSESFQKSTTFFNSGDNQSVYVGLVYYALSDTLVCDDFCLIEGLSSDYAKITYETGDEKAQNVTEYALKGSTYTIQKCTYVPVAKTFTDWTANDTSYAANSTITVTEDITFTANYTDFTSEHLSDNTTFDPANYDYTFAVIPDPQKVNSLYPGYYSDITDWILNNKDAYNIKAAMNLGDITDGNYVFEWIRAKEAYDKLTGVIPYTLSLGNHDYVSGQLKGSFAADEERITKTFNRFFKQEDYNKLESWGGAYDDSMDNTYQFVTVGKTKYMLMALEYQPRYEVLDWACEVVEKHPECKVIVTTHSHLLQDGTRIEESPYVFTNPENSANPQEVWDRLLKVYPNILMLICGHESTMQNVVVKNKGDNGNTVYEILIDNQDEDINLKGVGAVTLLGFYEDGTKIDFTTYSTFQDKYILSESNEFTLELDKTIDFEGPGIATYDQEVIDGVLHTTYAADPYVGSEFVGWYDKDGNLVSKQLVHTTATYTYLKAVFDGYNVIFDGDFEKNTLPDWLVSTSNRFSIEEYETTQNGKGNGYLKYGATTQDTINSAFKLPVEKDTDYYLSFDVKINDFGANGALRFGLQHTLGNWDAVAAVGGGTQVFKNPNTGYEKTYTSAVGASHRPGTHVAIKEYYNEFDNDWMKFTLKFNSGSDENVFGSGETGCIYFMFYALNNGIDVMVDNVVFASQTEVKAKNEDGGSAVADKQSAVPGEEITFTATPDYGNEFAGWYFNGTLLSKELVFTTTEYVALTAKFDKLNGADDGGFENGTTGEWVTMFEGVTLENATHDDTSDSYFGSKYLKAVDTDDYYLGFYLPIKAEANTKYLIHFSYKVTADANTRTDIMLSPKNSWGNFTDVQFNASSSTYNYTATGKAFGQYMSDNLVKHFGDGFIEMNVFVNTAEELQSDYMYLLMGAQNGATFYIDNVSVTKLEDIAPSMLGSSLVTEDSSYKEGTISYKSSIGFIPESATMTAMGTIVMPTQLLNGELTWEVENLSHAGVSNTSGLNFTEDSFYAVFRNTSSINPSAKLSARSYCKITDRHGRYEWTLYSENENSSVAITNGVYNRSVNQVKRLLAHSIISRLEGNYPSDFFSDYDVTETTNVKSSASVSVDKVWNFVKRNAHLIGTGSSSVADSSDNLIIDGGFENDEFYLGAHNTTLIDGEEFSYTIYNEGNGVIYENDRDGFICYLNGDFYADRSCFSIVDSKSSSYSGNKCLKIGRRDGVASYILQDLLPNTDYELSYYWKTAEDHPVYIDKTYIYPYRYMDSSYKYVKDVDVDGTTARLYKLDNAHYFHPDIRQLESDALAYTLGPKYSNNEWQKITLKFNSENNTELVLGISFGSRVKNGAILIDDLCLKESPIQEIGVQNGDFSEGRVGWEGNAQTYKIAGKSSATLVNRGDYLKQTVGVKKNTNYTLKVTAKTSVADALYFGVTDIGHRDLNPTTAFTNTSHKVSDSTGTVTYTVDFYSESTDFVNVFLKSVTDSGKVHILSVELIETDELITYDTVDFENGFTTVSNGVGMNDFLAKTNKIWYQVVKEQAHSGKHSLRMLATATDEYDSDEFVEETLNSNIITADGDKLKHPLYQHWSTFIVKPGTYYSISYYVKPKTAGVSFDSSIRTVDTSDWDYMHAVDKKTVTLDSTDWVKVEHIFAVDVSCEQSTYVNLVISANDATTANLYFDDIVIKKTNTVVDAETPSALYTEPLYNLIDNNDFEDTANTAYTSGGTYMSGDAYSGSNFLRVEAGKKIVVPIETRKEYDYSKFLHYTLSGAVRASNGGSGYVGLSHTADGNTFFKDENGNVAGKLVAGTTDWSFTGFSYLSSTVVLTYLVIECTAGYIDVDMLSLFTDRHAFSENRNVVHEKYDYDDTTNAIKNGGTYNSSAVRLNVSTTQANNTFTGISATVYHPMISDVMGREFTEEQLDLELTRMKNAGIKLVRTMFKSQWAYTGNEMDPWDWNSDKMQQFYAWCDKLAEYDIDVAVVLGWSLSNFVYGGTSISEVSYLSPRKLDSDGNLQYAISWGIFHPVLDTELAIKRYAEWGTQAILAIRDHGVTNVTHALTFNEPSHRNGTLYQGAHAKNMLGLVDGLVDKMSSTYTDSTNTTTVRDSIILVGPNQSNPANVAGLADYFLENSKHGADLYDIWTTHYIETTKVPDSTESDPPAEVMGPDGDVYSSAKARFEGWMTNFQDKVFWCDEFACGEPGFRKLIDPTTGELAYTDEELRWWAVKEASQYTALMNTGLSGGILWQFADCPWSYLSGTGGEFMYGIHMTGSTRSALESQTPYYIYYSLTLLTKYMSCGEYATTYVCNSNNANVHIAAVKFADGNWSFLVVNNNLEAKDILIWNNTSLNGKTMYRHTYEAATVEPDSTGTIIDADKTFTNIKNILNDNVPAGSVTVYTTIKG